jgi:hypothetical protein
LMNCSNRKDIRFSPDAPGLFFEKVLGEIRIST